MEQVVVRIRCSFLSIASDTALSKRRARGSADAAGEDLRRSGLLSDLRDDRDAVAAPQA